MDHESSTHSTPGVLAERPTSRPPWRLVAVLAVVVLALVVALVVIRAQDGRPRATVGQVFADSSTGDPVPHLGEVLLPWARTKVGAGEPRDELPDLEGADANVRAPDDGSFVQVEMDLAKDYAIPVAALSVPFTAQASVVLRADGHDYPVPDLVIDPNGPYGQGGSRWVAVDGRPTDLEVRVTVDGVTQVVDASDGSVDPGQAADLADLADAAADDDLTNPPSTPCGAPRRLDTTGLRVTYRPALTCKVVLALRTPYVDGLGWAAAGHEYVVVQLARPRSLHLATGRGDDTQFWDSELRLTARLGDAEPVAPPIDANDLATGLTLQSVDDPEQQVFDVAAGEPLGDLVVDLEVRARLGEPFVTQRRTMRFEWTVAGGELA